MDLTYIYHAAAIIIGLAFPVYAIINRNDARKILTDTPGKLVYVYRQILLLQILLLALAVFPLILNGQSLEAIGLSFIFQPIWVFGLLGACVFGFWLINKIEIKDDQVEKMTQEYKDVVFLMPSSTREYKWSIVLSFVAGTFEEVIFRGFLFWRFNEYIPTIPAIIAVGVVFALVHFETKIKNMMSAFGLSILFSATYYFSGSLWIAMLIHVLVDIYSVTCGFKLCNKRRALETNTIAG